MPPGSGDSRAVQLTQPGMAALAVVRLEGPLAELFVARHFRKWHGSPRAESATRGGAVAASAFTGRHDPAQPRSHGFSSAALRARPCHLPARRLVYGLWRDGGEVLDDIVIVRDGSLYEVSLHGGVRIVARLLEQAAAAGFEIVSGDAAIDAAAGNDVDAWLPRASTERGLRLLLEQPAAWAALDPERVDIVALLADQTLYRLLTPATVAIVGAPNVGKSTLANALFGQERSIVADIPGTTRDWVGGMAELSGVPVVLVDTPGRRQTTDAIEREAIEISHGPVAAADLVIHLIDAVCPGQNDALNPKALQVANKCDLAAAPQGFVEISAKTGQGLARLISEIHRRLGVDV